MIRRPPRSTQSRSSAASDVYKQKELERFLRDVILPGRNYHIEHRWSGIMGLGGDKQPIIRAINDHVFCAVRMGGMGVALAPMIGEKIAALMTGEISEY